VNAGAIPVSSDGLPERLPWFEHLDDLALVEEIHRSGEDHPQPIGGLTVFDEDHFAGRKSPIEGIRRERAQLVGIESVERRVTRQKCVQVLHVGPLNCVRIAPGTRSGDMPAYGPSVTDN